MIFSFQEVKKVAFQQLIPSLEKWALVTFWYLLLREFYFLLFCDWCVWSVESQIKNRGFDMWSSSSTSVGVRWEPSAGFWHFVIRLGGPAGRRAGERCGITLAAGFVVVCAAASASSSSSSVPCPLQPLASLPHIQTSPYSAVQARLCNTTGRSAAILI